MKYKFPSTNMDDNAYSTKIIPLMKKFIKKHPWSGEIEADRWFRYDYKIAGMTLNQDYFEPRLLIHIEINNFRICRHTRETNTINWENPKFHFWSAKKRNEYVRTWGLREMYLFVKLFSFPYQIGIGKIKLVENER